MKKNDVLSFIALFVFTSFFVILIFYFKSIFASADELQTEPLKVYLQNKQVLNYRLRPADGIIQMHSGDTISYVDVSAGVTYYSERNLAYYSASLPKGNQSISIVVFPYTPSADGIIVVDDAVDGTLTDLKVYYLDDSGSGGDPVDPGPDDPDNPGGDVSGDEPGTDDPGTDNPDNPSGPVVVDGDVSNALYEIRILLACILSVDIISIFSRRSRNGYS